MPFLAYIHAEEPDPEPGRPPWEPNWRLWRWIVAAGFVTYGATYTDGALGVLLVMVIFGLICRALVELMPKGDGMRDYHQ